MQKMILPWCSTGSRVAISPDHVAKVALGWVSNDQPKAENWNYIQGERDDGLLDAIKGAAIGGHGIDPTTFEGNDLNRIPIMRPNAFAGAENIWAPSSEYNTFQIPGWSPFIDSAMGWDPSQNQPVLIFYSHFSMVGGGTSATLALVKCWDHSSAPVAYLERTINFGFIASDAEMPLLICDGYLYALVTRSNSNATKTLLKYSLFGVWTGEPVATLNIGIDSAAYGNYVATELVELAGGKIGFFGRIQTTARFFVALKSMASFTMASSAGTTPAAIHRQCRTDGYTAFTGGLHSDGVPHVVYCTVGDVAISNLAGPSAASTMGNIVDILPLTTDPEVPKIACLTVDTSAPYGIRIYTVGIGGSFVFHTQNFSVGGTNFDQTHCPCFGAYGAEAYVYYNRYLDSIANSSYGSVARFDPSLLLKDFSGAEVEPSYFAPDITYGTYAGNTISGAHSATAIASKLYHDGRSLWAIDMSTGKANRIVAAGTRS